MQSERKKNSFKYGIGKNTSGIVYNLTTIKKIGKYYKLSTLSHPIKEAGFERKKDHTPKNSVYDEKLFNNLARARTTIKEYALCNNFEYFVTLTLDKDKYDRYNLDKYIKDLGQFIRDYRKKYKADIQYLLIPEMHKDGAWHIHGLIFGLKENHLQNFDTIADAPKKLKGKDYYNFELYQRKFGFCSFGKIKDLEKVSSYITKYIKKDLGKGIEQGHKSYYVSRKLNKPQLIKKGTLAEGSIVEYEYVNEYVKIAKLENIDNIDII